MCTRTMPSKQACGTPRDDTPPATGSSVRMLFSVFRILFIYGACACHHVVASCPCQCMPPMLPTMEDARQQARCCEGKPDPCQLPEAGTPDTLR
jgi:hypothetical protein